MPAVPVNSDLPSSNLIPGVYLKLNLSGTGAGLNQPSKRLLLLGYKTSAGSAQAGSPIRINSQTDSRTYAGRGSDLDRMYAAAISQGIAGLADVWMLPITAPSGTAQTRLIVAAGTATSAGFIDIFICGRKCTVTVASSDTSTTVATAIDTAIATIEDDLPCTATVSSSTVTLTARHAALTSADIPVIINKTGAAGITLNMGTVTYANAATGAGTTTVTTGGQSVSATISNLDSVTTIASALTTAINAGAYPFTATSSVGVVTLFYVNDRVVNQITGTISAAIATTQTLAVGDAATGAPTLTTALSNMEAQAAFPLWVTAFNDGNGGSSSIATLKTHIDTQANGANMKGQVLVFGSSDVLATAGAVQTSTGVQSATNGPNYCETWCPGAPQQAYELAARVAAAFVVEDYKPKNWDAFPLATSGTVPLMAPHAAVRPSRADQNSALYTYYMTPLVYHEASNTLRIVRARTTSSDADSRNWDVSMALTANYIRDDISTFLALRLGGKSLKTTGTPKTPNCITTTSVKDALIERIQLYDDTDLFDDAEALRPQVRAEVDSIVPTRINVFIPFRPPVPFHQGGGGIYLV